MKNSNRKLHNLMSKQQKIHSDDPKAERKIYNDRKTIEAKVLKGLDKALTDYADAFKALAEYDKK